MVYGSPGQNIKSICPYCGAKATVVTPGDSSSDDTVAVSAAPAVGNAGKSYVKKPLYWKVTVWFLVIVTALFLLLTILYFLFTAVSK